MNVRAISSSFNERSEIITIMIAVRKINTVKKTIHREVDDIRI